jgi:hypothetical protein
MTGLRKKIETMMAAITFAEEGEFETAKSLMKSRKRVLLAVNNSRIDSKTCTYAVNTSKRIDSGIDILVVGDTEQELMASALEPFTSQLQAEAIPFSLIKRTGCFKQAILDYLEEEDNTLFVVIESQDSANLNCAAKDKRLADAWRRLKCPLVVVAEGLKT